MTSDPATAAVMVSMVKSGGKPPSVSTGCHSASTAHARSSSSPALRKKPNRPIVSRLMGRLTARSTGRR